LYIIRPFSNDSSISNGVNYNRYALPPTIEGVGIDLGDVNGLEQRESIVKNCAKYYIPINTMIPFCMDSDLVIAFLQ
jgi:hypothetical protein